jgi:hypothetical protein
MMTTFKLAANLKAVRCMLVMLAAYLGAWDQHLTAL